MKKGSIILIIGIIILIPLMWYLASPLFIDKTVNEELPPSINNQNQQNPDNGNIQIIVTEQDIKYQGNFKDADSFHKVKGLAKVVNVDGIDYLSLENFESTNGPDLKVYLSEDLNANSFVSLGELKGNIGNQNYQIPDNTDIEKYKHALIWCEQFSVLFGSAELN